jgi:hypothetical protein
MALWGDGRSRGERRAPGLRASGGRRWIAVAGGLSSAVFMAAVALIGGGDVRGQSSGRPDNLAKGVCSEQ